MIPARFADSEPLRDAYQRGVAHALGIAARVVPTLGTDLQTDTYGTTLVTAANIRSLHVVECYEAEDHSRSFTPFEIIASAFNRASNAEELWEAFDTGVHDAIDSDLAAYDDAAYGIVPGIAL